MGMFEPVREVGTWIRGHLPSSFQLKQMKHLKWPEFNYIMVHCKSIDILRDICRSDA